MKERMNHMREVYLDLTLDEAVARYRFAGYEGEHNATRVTVLLPERMRPSGEAQYRFLFETAKGESIFSAPMYLSAQGTLEILLTKSLAVAPILKVCVCCYLMQGEEAELVAKSPEILLGIQKSISENSSELDGHGGEIPGLVVETVLADSKNPVESRVILKALEEKLGTSDLCTVLRDFDQASDALPVSEKAVAKAIDSLKKSDSAAMDKEFSLESGNGVENRVLSQSLAPALKGVQAGNVIRLQDQSALPHKVSLRAEGKNLIRYPYDETTKTENGLSFTDWKDGRITVDGTASAETYFRMGRSDENLMPGSYYLSGNVSLELFPLGERDSVCYHAPCVILVKKESKYSVYRRFSSGESVNQLILKPQLERGLAETPWAPYLSQLAIVRYERGTYLLCEDEAEFELKSAVGDLLAFSHYDEQGNAYFLDGSAVYPYEDCAEYLQGLHAGDYCQTYLDSYDSLCLDTVTVISTPISVKKYGKNLMDFKVPFLKNGLFTEEDGVIKGENAHTEACCLTIGDEFLGKKLTVSVWLKHFGTRGLRVAAKHSDFTPLAEGSIVEEAEVFGKSVLTFTPEKSGDFVHITWDLHYCPVEIKEFQVEVGEYATEYEAYREPILCAVEENGRIVDGANDLRDVTYVTDSAFSLVAEYHRDLTCAWRKLQEAIADLGGVL